MIDVTDTALGGVPRWLRGGEEGQSIVVSAVFMIVLLGFLGIAVDVGNAMLQKRRLQAAVDMGLLSGAQDMPNATTAATDAKSYTLTNYQKVTSSPLAMSTTTSCQVTGCSSPDQLNMTATATVPTAFLSLFGVKNWTISASGAACGPCDSSAVKYDVVVVLDRSYSMCLDENGAGYADGKCDDIVNAVAGIKSLESFFNPTTDRLGLVLLSSEENVKAYQYPNTGAAPCDTINSSDLSAIGGPAVTAEVKGTALAGMFQGSLGDFMQGTPASHNSWLVAPLSSTFKNANGTLNTTGAFNTALGCVQPKFWTPMAPAVQAAAQELQTDGRADADKIIVYFGDGGGDAQPMKVDSSGNATPTQSWYTPTAGNNNKPCEDAIGQADIAQSEGITVYTIGYDLNASYANLCRQNNFVVEPSGISAQTTLLDMASEPADFYQQATAGQVLAIFNAIGHSITSGGTRLVQ